MERFSITPVAFIKNNRTDLKDDYWGAEISEIVLAESIPSDSLIGLQEFSHIDVIFLLDKIYGNDVKFSCHPRENPDWPVVGIFAIRRKLRPNYIGATFAEIVEVKERSILVKNLDAIDGTPVIDIKPLIKEFIPVGEISQPKWATELMTNYWK